MADRVQQLTEAIRVVHEAETRSDSADPDRRIQEAAKLHAQRCTAHIEAQDYPAALADAQHLVRALPDAPVGYLKAARCYRLLRRWKAAKTMLEATRARAPRSDESTLKALKSELKKLQAAMAEPKSSFIERLPTELFVHALSHLPQADIIHASHVSQRWRTVVHSHRELWTSMELIVPNTFTRATARSLDDKVQFYLDRLQGASLQHFTVGYASPLPPASSVPGAAPPSRQEKVAFLAKQRKALGKDGALKRVVSVALINVPSHPDWSIYLSLVDAESLLHLKYILPSRASLPEDASPGSILERFPKLQTLVLSDQGAGQRRKDWPPTANQSLVPEGSSPLRVLRLDLSGPSGFVDSLETEDEPGAKIFENLTSLYYRSNRPFYTPYPLSHLRHITLQSTPIFTTGSVTGHSDSFTQLESLNILAGVHPVAVRALLDATDSGATLRTLVLASPLSGADMPGAPALQLAAASGITWDTFVRRHPDLTTLRIANISIPSLSLSLLNLPQLTELSCTNSELPVALLVSAISPNLPHLRSLDVSGSTNITSSPLLRLVQSKEGRLQELGIEGCRDLHKEAVDWLKKNVAKVRWTGWGEKNAGKPFGFR